MQTTQHEESITSLVSNLHYHGAVVVLNAERRWTLETDLRHPPGYLNATTAFGEAGIYPTSTDRGELPAALR